MALLLSALAMTLIVGVRYLITSGAFAFATRLRHPGLYTGLTPQIRRDQEYAEKLAILQAEIDKGFASGVTKRSVDEIFEDVRKRISAD